MLFVVTIEIKIIDMATRITTVSASGEDVKLSLYY